MVIADWRTATGSRRVRAIVAVRKGLEQRTDLLEVLGRLQYPAVRPAQVAEHLQLASEEAVVLSLIESQIAVPPCGNPCVPLEGVGAEVEVDELAVLLDAPRRSVVHRAR